MTPEPEIPRDPADNPDLVAAYQQVVERYRGPTRIDQMPPEPPPKVARTRPWLVASGVLAALALVYIWGARPAWLFSRDAIRTRSAAQEDSSLRLGLYLEYHRVMAYRKAKGRVPAALDEAGDVEDGVAYAATGDSTFELTAANERLTLQLHQSDNPETVWDENAGGDKAVR